MRSVRWSRVAVAMVMVAAITGVTLVLSPGSARTAPAPTDASPPFPCPPLPAAAGADAGLHAVHAFGGPDGAAPWGSLNRLGTKIYGRTLNGGQAGAGTLFALDLDGTHYEVVHSFPAGADNTEGSHPRHDSMWWDGARFWGTLMDGGRSNNGAIFTFDPATWAVTTVHLDAGAPADAMESHSGLVAGGDGALYVLSAKGGAHGKGSIVRVDPSSAATELVYSFEKKSGDESHGRLTLGPDGHTLYGMTRTGGAADTGVVFSFDPATRTYAVLHEFGAPTDATNGATADHGFLTVVGDQLWGVTADGGDQTKGTVFRMTPDGTGFTIVHSFGAGGDGQKPHASLVQNGDFLYATAITGGASGRGTVWRVRTDGTGYETVASFDGRTTGGYPKGNVTFSDDGTTMFGTTIAGGANDSDCTQSFGTVFALATPADPSTVPATPAPAPPAEPAAVNPTTTG